MAFGNSSFDTILSTTLKNYREQLVDNIFTSRPLFFYLDRDGMVEQGGEKIVVPVLGGKNTTAGSYSGADTISITAQTGITAAEYSWKQFAASVFITGLEEAQNYGEHAIIDLLQSKVMQAEESIKEALDEDLVAGDGTGNSSKDFNGLVNLIGTTNTVGGIDGNDSDNTWWRSYVEGSAGSLTLADMATAQNTVSFGNDKPKLILTTQTLYEAYEALLQPQQIFQSSQAADAGFDTLMHKGVPVHYDAYTPSGVMYFVNTSYIKLVKHTAKWFEPTPFVKPTNQDVRVAQILCYGNLVVMSRRHQGKLTGRTA